MSAVLEMSPNSFFDNFELVHRKVDAGFRGFEHERQSQQFVRNLSAAFEEEYQRSMEDLRRREAQELRRDLDQKAKADFVHHIQKSFALKLSEVTRGPLASNHPAQQSQQSQRTRLQKPPLLKEGRSHRDQAREAPAAAGQSRLKGSAPRARRELSLNGTADSELEGHYKVSRSLDAKDKPASKKSGFAEFMSRLKEKSIISYLKSKQRRNQSQLEQPLFNSRKYEQQEQPQYDKLRSYLLANFERHGPRLASTARSGELEYLSIKETLADRHRDLLCEDPPKTASTNYPSSTSRLKHLVSFRDKDSHKASAPFPDRQAREDPPDAINAQLTLGRKELAKSRIRREASSRQFRLDTSSFIQPLTNHIPSPSSQNQMKRSKRNLSSKLHSIRVFRPPSLFEAEASCIRLGDSKASETASNINQSGVEQLPGNRPVFLPRDIFMKLKAVTGRPKLDGEGTKPRGCERGRAVDCSTAERSALVADGRVERIG